MGKYIDGSGLSHFMGILKGAFAVKADAVKNITRSGTTFTATRADGTSFTFTQQDNTVAKTTTTPKMDGTAAIGSETKYAAGDHVHPTDTTRVPTSRTVNGKALSANITLSGDDIMRDGDSGESIADVLDDFDEYFVAIEEGMASAFTSQSIDGVKVNGDFKAYRFATCSTAAATAAKTITLESSVTLEAGLIVYVKFANTNSAAVANLTLAITAPTSATDSTAVTTTAKPIKYRGANLPAVGYLAANRVYPFVYDGTNWELVGDLDTNTHNNTFSKVKVGSTTVEADSGADTLELVAGTNVTLTPDATNDKVTITSSDTDTKNTAGSTDSSSKLFLVGATSQAANPQTYSQDTAYVGTDGHLYSNSVQVVNLSGSQALTNKTYNGYTLAAACAKAVVTSVDTSASLPTSGAVKTYVDNSVSTATAGALQYKGTVAAESTITGAAYKKGWYYVVSTAGTYLGKVCEVGDMLIAKQDKTSTPANDWDAVQSNIEVLSNSEIDALWAAA